MIHPDNQQEAAVSKTPFFVIPAKEGIHTYLIFSTLISPDLVRACQASDRDDVLGFLRHPLSMIPNN